jgi:hypothetical protein
MMRAVEARFYGVVCSFILMLALFASPSAFARGPDEPSSYYENSCLNPGSGDMHGFGITLTRTSSGYDMLFCDTTGQQNPYVHAEVRITGDSIEFEATNYNSVRVRFVGSITPEEIKGRFREGRPDYEINDEVRLKRADPYRTFPTC